VATRNRRRKMTEAELKTSVQRAIQNSDSFDSSEVSDNFQKALNSYLGRKEGASIPSDADERSHDVADMIESVTANLLPAFKAFALLWASSCHDIMCVPPRGVFPSIVV